MKVAGLFSGIGGLEIPFRNRGAETTLICDVWEEAQKVLRRRFPDTPIHDDIGTLGRLPAETAVVTAGFPCTDLSQAGKTAGIGGTESGLVEHVFRLLRNREVEWLVLENVRNMLVLDGGGAMHYLTSRLEQLGFRWAYRVVDSRFTGVPQRRHRVLMVASRDHDPRRVLFADEAGDPMEPGEPPREMLRDDSFGFYWTEGLRGLGWVCDGVPPLKGGSGVGIPSPPAIWLPQRELGGRLVTPPIEDAEAFQGFDRGWTHPARTANRNGPRWKLVGNAVTVGVAEWLVGRIYEPGDVDVPMWRIDDLKKWPQAAWGGDGETWAVMASAWPERRPYNHLTDVLTHDALAPLSARAASGFLERARRARLRFQPGFLEDVADHAAFMRSNREESGDPTSQGRRVA